MTYAHQRTTTVPLRSLWVASAVGGLSQSLAGSAGAVGAAVVVVSTLGGQLAGILAGSLLFGAGNTAVMLGRYAAADLGREADRARAMASVLVATTVGAVAGPNLLAPAGALATGLGLPLLAGPYLVAVVGFAAAGLTLAGGLRVAVPDRSQAPQTADTPLGRDGAAGLVVLGLVNLVMVAVMTMAPVHLHNHGVGLGMIGLVVSAHIAGMFVPSPLSGWLTERVGPSRVARLSGATLLAACVLAAVSPTAWLLAAALLLVGVGWNLGLVSGSVLLTAHVPEHARPRREGWGEVSMGAAAASGGAASGVVATAGGYPTLAATTAAIAVLLVPLIAWLLPGRTGRSSTGDRPEPTHGLVELGQQPGHDVGDRPDLVHPADDLADRHRDGVGVVPPIQPVVGVCHEQVLQGHRQRCRGIL